MPDTFNIFGTKANDLTALAGSIPDTQLVIVPDPVTGKLLRSTFGQIKADVILAFGSLSYLDQIIEVPQVANLPQPGEVKKIYVITGAGPDQNKQFRWGGSIYVEFPQGSGDVASEAIIRGNADANLQAQIDAEITNRQNADAGLQTNITNEATARSNADTLLSQQIASEANTRANNDSVLSGLINSEGVTRLNADNVLSARIDQKLNISDYNPNFKGKYTTLAALQTALPTAIAGNYAQVDAGEGSNVINYNWDDEEGWVVGSAVGPSIASTDDLTEGSTNLYFTAARVLAAISGIANRISISAGVIDIASTYVGQNSITTLGIIGTGTWQGTAIASGYGGTGFSSYAKGDLIYASAANILSKLAAGTDGYVLTLASGVPTWAAASGGTSLPSQTGNAGKLLTTDGTNLSWGTAIPGIWSVSGTSLYYDAGDVGIINNIAATSGVPQNSPNLYLGGSSWVSSGSPAASKIITWKIYAKGYSSSAQNSSLEFSPTIDGVTYPTPFSIGYSGIITFNTLSGNAVNASTFNSTYVLINNKVEQKWSYTNGFGDSFAFAYTAAINRTTGTGIFRGFYFNPILTSLTGVTLVAFQNTAGDCLFGTTSGSVGIGATTTIDPSAIFQVASTTKGCLFSRMSTSDASSIASKAESLFMYDTTLKKYKFWNGSAFEVISSS